jgi:hypothetical protein
MELQNGTQIVVRTLNGVEHRGQVQEDTDRGLTIQTQRLGVVLVPWTAVESVQLSGSRRT